MGARLADLELVRLAKEARWIVAIGLSADDGASEVEALVASRIAGGGFGVLPHDNPTNNPARVASPHHARSEEPTATKNRRGRPATRAP